MAASPKLGSKVQHIYKQLYPWKSKFDLASYLCKNIFYSSDGVIAINKPFGVGLKNLSEEELEALHKTKTINTLHTSGVGSTYTLEDTLPIMRKELNLPDLVVVKSAEKYHSGVTILAENEKAAPRISQALFLAKAQDQFSTFWIVSPYVPMEGGNGSEFKERVGLTMQKNPKHDISQPVIARDFSINSVKRRDVRPGRVAYLVRSISPTKASLVELKSSATRRNFLRIYCADMLMPILGDHLYSSRVITIKGKQAHLHPLHLKPGTVNQKLSQEILSSLGLYKPEDSATVPLHVHLRNVTLADFNGRRKHLILTAPCSDIFKWTCDALKLTVPTDVT